MWIRSEPLRGADAWRKIEALDPSVALAEFWKLNSKQFPSGYFMESEASA